MKYHLELLLIYSSITHVQGQQLIPATSQKSRQEVPATAVISGSTITQTFTATTLSQYASATAAHPVTITDELGAIILSGIVFAGGLAWLLRPRPNVPVPELPSTPPSIQTETPPSEQKTTTATTTSAKSETTDLAPLSMYDTTAPASFFSGDAAQVIIIPNDEKICGFANDDPAEVSREEGDKRINDFCKKNKDKPLGINAPVHENAIYGAGMILNLTVTQNKGCSGESDLMINEDDCNSSFHEILDDCDTKTITQKHGGTLNDACYSYTLHPQDFDGELHCAPFKTGTGVNRDQAKSKIEAFCKANDGKSVTPGSLNVSEMFKMDFGDSVLWLRTDYNTQDQTCDQKQGTYTLNERACNRYFMLLLDSCNKDAGPHLGKYGGNLTDHCGVYSFDSLMSESLTCGDMNDIWSGTPHDVPQDAGEKAIDDFCNNKDSGLSTEPSTGQFIQFADDVGNKAQPGGWVIRMQLNWAEGKYEEGCAPRKDYKVDPEDCKRKLRRLLGECSSKSCLEAS